MVILNRSAYISKFSKILKDNSRFKLVNTEGKNLNHLIHMEEQPACLLKSWEDQDEISTQNPTKKTILQ